VIIRPKSSVFSSIGPVINIEKYETSEGAEKFEATNQSSINNSSFDEEKENNLIQKQISSEKKNFSVT
jgi:uncharacterized protein YfkK (UPF0435 family)